ncbi:MAG: alpha-L-fucosidase [Gemmatimonadetes bacterium]|nr:alpha-L-fucosidase [Gemmatimonadota bacterium]
MSEYDVMATPYRRDIMRQFADACRRHGLKLGWYYSIMDWYHSTLPAPRLGAARRHRGRLRALRALHARAAARTAHADGEISVLWF